LDSITLSASNQLEALTLLSKAREEEQEVLNEYRRKLIEL
jgi:hypothetical protein